MKVKSDEIEDAEVRGGRGRDLLISSNAMTSKILNSFDCVRK